jgi:vitamin B12 transporter
MGHAAGRLRAVTPPSQETVEVCSQCDFHAHRTTFKLPRERERRRKMNSIQLRFTILSFFASLLLTAVPLNAQTNAANAHLTGMLLDSSGAAVGDVRITAQPEGQSGAPVSSANSSADGHYVLSVPPGRFRVRFERPPFTARDATLNFTAGENRVLDLQLHLEPLSSSVIVTAQAEPALERDTTAPVTVITRDEIDRRQAVTITDALFFAPGISIGRNGPQGGLASIFLDGGNSSFTKVLIDGTPVNEPGNAVDFSNFTLDNIDKIEIVHGAESSLYGSDAVAGVIQLFTHRGATRIPEFSMFGEGGTFNTGRGGGELSGLLGAFDYSAAASYFQTEGQGPNNTFRNRTLSGNFGYAFTNTNQIRLALRNNTSNAGIPGQTLFDAPRLYQINDLHDFSANARWDFSSGTHWHHQLSGAESYHHQISANPVASFPGDFTFADTFQYNRASVNAQTSYLLPKFGVTLGYQNEIENGFVSYLNVGHIRRNNQGGFLDVRYRPHSHVSIDLGLRAEANGNFGTRVVPRAEAAVTLRFGTGFWGDTRYHVFYGQGIKEPRFDQSYGFDPCFPGNPTLKPEQSKTWSTGVEQKLAGDRAKISADYYSNRFYDMVSFAFCFPGKPCPATPPAGCGFGFGNFFNTDLARARGTNISAEVRPLRWLMIAGNYSYADTLVIASPNTSDPALLPGNRLIRRPPHSGSLTINTAFRGLNLTLAGYFTGVRTDSDFHFLNLTRNPGYARFDVAASYDFRHGVSLYAHANNVFDKQYQEVLGYPALGRDVRVGMKYRFSGRD